MNDNITRMTTCLTNFDKHFLLLYEHYLIRKKTIEKNIQTAKQTKSEYLLFGQSDGSFLIISICSAQQTKIDHED